jgi:hypothetical protein
MTDTTRSELSELTDEELLTLAEGGAIYESMREAVFPLDTNAKSDVEQLPPLSPVLAHELEVARVWRLIGFLLSAAEQLEDERLEADVTAFLYDTVFEKFHLQVSKLDAVKKAADARWAKEREKFKPVIVLCEKMRDAGNDWDSIRNALRKNAATKKLVKDLQDKPLRRKVRKFVDLPALRRNP